VPGHGCLAADVQAEQAEDQHQQDAREQAGEEHLVDADTGNDTVEQDGEAGWKQQSQ
jgi:hypothetical protein